MPDTANDSNPHLYTHPTHVHAATWQAPTHTPAQSTRQKNHRHRTIACCDTCTAAGPGQNAALLLASSDTCTAADSSRIRVTYASNNQDLHAVREDTHLVYCLERPPTVLNSTADTLIWDQGFAALCQHSRTPTKTYRPRKPCHRTQQTSLLPSHSRIQPVQHRTSAHTLLHHTLLHSVCNTCQWHQLLAAAALALLLLPESKKFRASAASCQVLTGFSACTPQCGTDGGGARHPSLTLCLTPCPLPTLLLCWGPPRPPHSASSSP